MVYKNFHKGKYFMTFKRGFEESKKDITLTVDKLFENDSLRLTLSDDEDPTFLCRISLTRCDYEDLKKQQGLLIDFDNFPLQVVRLLQQCASNNMFLIVHQLNPLQYNFEVVEHNEFRRLVHLCLKTGPACESDLKQHMAETINELKRVLASLKSTMSSNEIHWNDKCSKMEAKIHDLILTVSKMEEDKLRHEKEFQEALKLEKDRLAQEKLQLQKDADMKAKNLLTISQDNLSKKERDIEELMRNLKQLQENIMQLEYQLSDKTQRSNLLENEVQKSHIEAATLKARNMSLERDVVEKEKQINQLNSKCTYLEKVVKDNSDTMKELNESIQSLKVEKSNLERRLTLSESLANKNTEAAHSTTEQLLKANQIIAKQNNELIEMKEKLLCRTAIALEQEKVIEQNTKEIEDLKSKIDLTKDCMDKVKSELESLKEKYEVNEQALKERDETIKNNNMVIQWLHKKVEDNGPVTELTQNRYKTGFQSATSSTPYFQEKNVQNELLHDTDDTINFYATSKLSNIEESPQPAPPTKKGLDPKYLKPAPEDNRVQRKGNALRSSLVNTQNKGKENKVVDLPKVNYKEKKSSRPTTYRATPVSAYFP